MKFFTGSLAAGLVLLAGGAQAQVRGPYTAASDFDAPYAVAPRPVPGPHYAYPGRARIRPRPRPVAVNGSLLRAARQRILAARHPQAARLRLHDCGDRPRRRGRPADNRRAQRPDHPLRAGLPDGRQCTTRSRARSAGPWGSAAAGPGAGPCPGRAAAVTAGPRVASRTVPMPKASPIAAKPAPAPVQQAAAPAPKSAEVQAARPGDNRRGSSQARPADCTDPGHALDAGAGVKHP